MRKHQDLTIVNVIQFKPLVRVSDSVIVTRVSGLVLPFPPAKRSDKVRDVASKLARCKTRRHHDHYLDSSFETMIGVLIRRGVHRDLATRESHRFIQAVLAESARI